jgi:hypothetical protein
VHHHTFQISQPTRRNNFSRLVLDVMYSSTCSGRPRAHHQEHNNCSSNLWFYRWSVMVAVLLVVVGPERSDHDQHHCYHHAPSVKPESATAVVELLMMGVRMPKTCWAVHTRQVINLRNCCIWLVDLFERVSNHFINPPFDTTCFAVKGDSTDDAFFTVKQPD